MTTQMTGWPGRALMALALAGALGACQSVDSLSSLLDGGGDAAQAPAPAPAPQEPPVRTQQPAGAQPQTQAGTNSGPGEADGLIRSQQQTSLASSEAAAPAPRAVPEAAAPAAPAAAQQAEPDAGESGEAAGGSGGEAAPEQETAAAASTGQGDEGRRVVDAPKGGGFAGDIGRRFDQLFSSGTTTTVREEAVKEQEVTGAWLLDEEDGLRTCAVTLAPKQSGAAVQPAEGCSGVATSATRWSTFGSDLLLSGADNTVLARLRRSGASWIGFTLTSGIPVVLTRPGAGSGDGGTG